MLRGIPGLDDGILDEAEAGFLNFLYTQFSLWHHFVIEVSQQLIELAYLAGIITGQYDFLHGVGYFANACC